MQRGLLGEDEFYSSSCRYSFFGHRMSLWIATVLSYHKNFLFEALLKVIILYCIGRLRYICWWPKSVINWYDEYTYIHNHAVGCCLRRLQTRRDVSYKSLSWYLATICLTWYAAYSGGCATLIRHTGSTSLLSAGHEMSTDKGGVGAESFPSRHRQRDRWPSQHPLQSRNRRTVTGDN